jgi:hypothetical protein
MILRTRFLFLLTTLTSSIAARAADAPKPPGVVIAHSPATSRTYIGSPGIAILPDGSYVASHDHFGPGSTWNRTFVYASKDRGATWSRLTELTGQWWSSLFVHRGALYLLGTTTEYGHLVIRRSTDGGKTWTTPADKRSGLLRDDGKFHCAPVPMLIHNGRLWRGFEDLSLPVKWGRSFRAFVMSAKLDADLLNADSWIFTNALPSDETWLGGCGGWLEGNVVATPEGHVVDILRVDTPGWPEKAALVHVSGDGKSATFDPAADFVDFPGASKKFTIRWDDKSRLYWSLANDVPEKFRKGKPARVRNTLALISSPDLRTWDVRSVILQHPDPEKHGFQYPDWLFDGDDIIAAVRTAFDEPGGQAHNQHDANWLTFHRIERFRDSTFEVSLRNEIVGAERDQPNSAASDPRLRATGSALRAAFAPGATGTISGNATIRGTAGDSEIVITATSRTAGAIHSLTWNGREFIDSFDHGRQLQSACSFDCGEPGRFVAETYNPTEAGSRRDGRTDTSSSRLLSLHAAGTDFETTSQMAFWVPPGESTAGVAARNTELLSKHRLAKRVRIGYRGLTNVIRYDVTFTVPDDEPPHRFAQFEALTGYMPPEFERFSKFNPMNGELEPLSDGPGEQPWPVVLATTSGSHAMGIFTPPTPPHGFDPIGYGRWRFAAERVVKWNCVFRLRRDAGITPGDYPFTCFVIVGDLDMVTQSLRSLNEEFGKM